MYQLLLSTQNRQKIREIFEIFNGFKMQILSLEDIGFVEEIDESGTTFEENARIKATVVANKTGYVTLGEDSGLEIDALGGKPGIYSARYTSGSDLDRIEKVLNDLKNVPQENRTARFKAVGVVYNPHSKKEHVYNDVSEGFITTESIGSNGFGYDPIFYSTELGKTFAQASMEEKNSVSHRGRVFRKFRQYFGTNVDLFLP